LFFPIAWNRSPAQDWLVNLSNIPTSNFRTFRIFYLLTFDDVQDILWFVWCVFSQIKKACPRERGLMFMCSDAPVQSFYDGEKVWVLLPEDFVGEHFGDQYPIKRVTPEIGMVLPDIGDFFTSGLFTRTVPIELVNEALREQDKESRRVRLLPAPTVVYFVMAMNLWRRSPQEEVLKKVHQGLKCLDPLFAFETFPSRAAISKARIRIGDDVLEKIAGKILGPIAQPETIGAWCKGFRVMAFDEACFPVLNDEPLAEHFGYPSVKQGEAAFPLAKTVALAEVGTRVIVDAETDVRKTSEVELARRLVNKNSLTEEMILLADGFFHGHELWRECSDVGTSLLWRVKNNLRKPVVERLPDGSFITEVKDGQDKKQPPIKVRVIEHHLSGEGLTSKQKGEKLSLCTNLFDHQKYPAEELAALYHERWGIETVFSELKTTLNCNAPLRSKTPELVKQEIWGLLITHFAVRQLIHEAALKHREDPDDISFKGAVRAIERALPQSALIRPHQMKAWMDGLLKELALAKCRRGTGKTNPRGVKRKMSRCIVRKRGMPSNQKQATEVRIIHR
jgi:hypothetical protein